MFEVPRPIPDVDPLRWVLDRFDDFGDLIETLELTEEQRTYLEKFPAEGFNAWAEKSLVDSRLFVSARWPNYTPGIWRGCPNDYAVRSCRDRSHPCGLCSTDDERTGCPF